MAIRPRFSCLASERSQVLNLGRIIDAADSGDYDGVTLTATSAATISSVIAFVANLKNWSGDDYELTADEIDQIDEIVGLLSTDITT